MLCDLGPLARVPCELEGFAQRREVLGGRQTRLCRAELDEHIDPSLGCRGLGQRPAQVGHRRLRCTLREGLAGRRPERVDHPPLAVWLGREQMRGDPVRWRVLGEQQARRIQVQRGQARLGQLRHDRLVDYRVRERKRLRGHQQADVSQPVGCSRRALTVETPELRGVTQPRVATQDPVMVVATTKDQLLEPISNPRADRRRLAEV